MADCPSICYCNCVPLCPGGAPLTINVTLGGAPSGGPDNCCAGYPSFFVGACATESGEWPCHYLGELGTDPCGDPESVFRPLLEIGLFTAPPDPTTPSAWINYGIYGGYRLYATTLSKHDLANCYFDSIQLALQYDPGCNFPGTATISAVQEGDDYQACLKEGACTEHCDDRDQQNCASVPTPPVGAPTVCCYDGAGACGCEEDESEECGPCQIEGETGTLPQGGCCAESTYEVCYGKSDEGSGGDAGCSGGGCAQTKAEPAFSRNVLTEISALFRRVQELVRPKIPALRTGPAGINLSMGNTVYRIGLPAAGPYQLPFRLIYSSLHANQESEYGYGWSGSLNLRIEFMSGNDYAALTNGSGINVYYKFLDSNGDFTPPALYPMSLHRNNDGSFTGTRTDGSTLEFDSSSSHRLTSLQSVGGQIWTLTYASGTNRLSNIEDPAGRLTTFSYSGSPLKISSIELPDGRTTDFTVVDGKLTEFETPEGCTTAFDYSVSGDYRHLSKVTDPALQVTTYGYNGAGWANTVERPDGTIVSISYMDWNNAVAEELKPGEETTSTWIKFSGPRSIKSYQTVGESPTTLTYSGGLVTSVKDARGYVTTLTYKELANQTRLLEGIHFPDNGRYTFLYDGNDRLESYIDAVGNRSTLVWTGNNRTGLIDAEGNRWTYSYDNGRVSAKENPLGERTTFHYDSLGQMDWRENPLGERTTFTYENGQRQSIINPEGEITTYIRDDANRVVQKINARGYTTSFTYAPNCLLESVENALGEKTTYQYNARNLLESVTNPLGERTTYAYDGLGNRITITNPLSKVTTQTFDSDKRLIAVENPLGEVTSFGYDAAGNLETIENPLGQVTTIQYDPMNRPAVQIDARGFRTTFTYDAAGRRIAVMNAAGHVTTTSYTPLNSVHVVEDATGEKTTFAYDDAGRLESVTNARGYKTTTIYDAAGRVEATINALGQRTTFGYDMAGRRTSVQNARGYVTTYGYDPTGNVTSITNPLNETRTMAYDELGRLRSSTDPQGQKTTTTYDAVGRVMESINPRGYKTTFTYDAAGRRTAIIDANGHVTTTNYDNADRIQSIEDALGHRTTFLYDDAGRREVLMDANGHKTTFQYDPTGNVTRETDPLGRKTTFTYTGLNQLETRLDARGAKATYIYDEVGRLEHQQFTDGGRYTYTYDEVGNRETMVDATGTTTYTYDALNRIDSSLNPDLQQITYSYDAVSNRIGMTAAAGRVTYVYDAANRLESLMDFAGEVTSYVYYAGNRIYQLRQNGDNVVTSFSYDQTGHITHIDYLNVNAETQLQDFRYTYDPVGNRTSLRELGGAVTTYGYDDANRLTSEHRTGGNNYRTTHTYDPVGNRLVENTDGQKTTFAYDDANQLETSETTSITTYVYDDAGNLNVQDADGALTTYTWNDDNRLTTATLPSSAVIAMAYNADGLRVRKVNASGTIKYVWDGQNVLAETNTSNVLQALYTYAPKLFGDLLSQRRGANTHYALSDALGSIIALAEPGGDYTDTYRYKAYGQPLETSGSTLNPYRWVGRLGYQFDSGLDTYYVRRRHYHPANAVWLSEDPLGVLRSANLFRYGFNSPIGIVDPSGLNPLAACGIGGGIAGGVSFLINYFIHEKGFCASSLDALLDGISACLIAAIASAPLPPGALKCAVAIVTAIVNNILKDVAEDWCAGCRPELTIDFCDVFDVVGQAATGCVAGFTDPDAMKGEIAAIMAALGFDYAVFGAACEA